MAGEFELTYKQSNSTLTIFDSLVSLMEELQMHKRMRDNSEG